MSRMHTVRCREIRTNGGREHNPFAQKRRVLDENRAENDCEEKNIPQSLDVDLASAGFFFRIGGRDAAKITPVENVKYQKQTEQRDRPGEPAMLNRPPKRYAFDVSEKKRRPHRG